MCLYGVTKWGDGKITMQPKFILTVLKKGAGFWTFWCLQTGRFLCLRLTNLD